MTERIVDTGLTENDLLAELARQMEAEMPRRKPGDVTANDLVKKTGKKREACREFLEKRVRAGELTTERVIDGGVWVKVYRKVK